MNELSLFFFLLYTQRKAAGRVASSCPDHESLQPTEIDQPDVYKCFPLLTQKKMIGDDVMFLLWGVFSSHKISKLSITSITSSITSKY